MIGAKLYQSNQNQDSLNDLVAQYAPLVKRLADQIKWRIPEGIEVDDLIQSGVIGLLEAKDKYNPDREASFKTYATLKIRYAMYEALRKHTGITRELSQAMKQIATAVGQLQQKDDDSTAKLTETLGISHQEYARVNEEINLLHARSFDELTDDELLPQSENDPFLRLADDQIKRQLKEVLLSLPQREQLVLALYYNEFLSFKEIGQILELTEARVSQIHSGLLRKLKSRLDEECFSGLAGVN